jgi:flagellar motility protein MotE (MotC chaperone)
MRGVRLLPIVLFATASLFVLKAAGLLAGGGYTLGGLPDARVQQAPPPRENTLVMPRAQPAAPPPKRSWAQEMFGFPDITGSVPDAKPAPAAPPAAAPAPTPAPAPGVGRRPGSRVPEGKPVTLDDQPGVPAGERAVLERLQERREELEIRSRELDIREGLLRAAEKRLEARIEELKQIEAQIAAATQKKEEGDAARLKGLVTMYETMKAKEAARIFDRLEARVLLEVASQISPRRMSEILAQMAPEAAERLTVELAARANGTHTAAPAELPKIEGRPRT